MLRAFAAAPNRPFPGTFAHLACAPFVRQHAASGSRRLASFEQLAGPTASRLRSRPELRVGVAPQLREAEVETGGRRTLVPGITQRGQAEKGRGKLEGIEVNAADVMGGQITLVDDDGRVRVTGELVSSGQLRPLVDSDKRIVERQERNHRRRGVLRQLEIGEGLVHLSLAEMDRSPNLEVRPEIRSPEQVRDLALVGQQELAGAERISSFDVEAGEVEVGAIERVKRGYGDAGQEPLDLGQSHLVLADRDVQSAARNRGFERFGRVSHDHIPDSLCSFDLVSECFNGLGQVPTRVVLSVAGIPLLSGCMMMGGIGHTGGLGGTAGAGHTESAQIGAPLERAEASSGGITIALSFRLPSHGAEVAIDAWLRADSAHHELADADIWLRIRTPSGGVDEIRMERLGSSGETYQAHYGFPTAGPYHVTAEGRVGTAAAVRTVSVTTRVEVEGESHDGRHDWLMVGGILGGLGMVVLMALMMGSR